MRANAPLIWPMKTWLVLVALEWEQTQHIIKRFCKLCFINMKFNFLFKPLWNTHARFPEQWLKWWTKLLSEGFRKTKHLHNSSKSKQDLPTMSLPANANRSHRVFTFQHSHIHYQFYHLQQLFKKTDFPFCLKSYWWWFALKANIWEKKKHEVPWVGKPASLHGHWGTSSQQAFRLTDPLRCGLQICGYFDTHMKEKLFPAWK